MSKDRKKNELISIIIPIYNGELYIKRCIHSVLNQTYKETEILLIDDGSIDSTSKMCRDLSEKYSKIKYFYQENAGPGAARNTGLKKTQGDYITFIDIDDFVHPKYIEELYKALKKNETLIAACSYIKIKYQKEAYKAKIYGKDIKLNRTEAIKSLFYEKELHGYTYMKLIHKSLLKNLQFPTDIRVGEDFIWCYHLLMHCNQIIYIDKELYYYVQNDSSIIHTKKTEDMIPFWKKFESDIREQNIFKLDEIKSAIRVKVFMTILKWIVSMDRESIKKPWVKEMKNYLKINSMSILKDTDCKRANRILALLCKINISATIIFIKVLLSIMHKKGLQLQKAV